MSERKEAERHATIWLQPWCDHCEWCDQGESGGRQWCQDEVWGECEDCGAKPVKYVLSPHEPSGAA